MIVGFFFGQQAAQEELRVLITEAMGDLVALVMILSLGFFFLILLVINTAISVLVAYFDIDGAVKLLGLVASFGILTVIIALTYKYAPDVIIT